MTKQTRRKFSAEFKANVALAAIKNQKTLAHLSQQYEVNPMTISTWKSDFPDNMAVIFQGERHDLSEVDSSDKDKLYAQIG